MTIVITCKLWNNTKCVCLRISYHVTSCLGLPEEDLQTAYLMSITWASHMADTMLVRDVKLWRNHTCFCHDRPLCREGFGMSTTALRQAVLNEAYWLLQNCSHCRFLDKFHYFFRVHHIKRQVGGAYSSRHNESRNSIWYWMVGQCHMKCLNYYLHNWEAKMVPYMDVTIYVSGRALIPYQL